MATRGSRKCSVVGCLNSNSTDSTKHFFTFRKEEEARQAWIKFCRRGKNFKPNTASLICQDHFEDSCFQATSKPGNHVLKKNSIPTIMFKDGKPFVVDKEEVLDPVFDSYKKLLKKRDQTLHEMKYSCRFCLQSGRILTSVDNFKTYTIEPQSWISDVIGFSSQLDGRFSKTACEECFQQIIAFDGFRRRCLASENRILRKLEDLEKKIEITRREICGEVDVSSEMNIEQIEEDVIEQLEEENVAEFSNSEEDSTTIPKKFEGNPEIFKSEASTDTIITDQTQQLMASRIYECFFCRLKFAGKITFKSHPCQIKSVTCDFPQCRKSFKKFNSLNIHRSQVHNFSKMSRLFCDICKLSMITTAEQFSEHRQICESNDEVRNFKMNLECEICGRMCLNIRGLTAHKLFHKKDPSQVFTQYSKDGQFRCKICDKICLNRRSLYSHNLRVHKETAENQEYTCDQCGKVCQKRYLLSNHIKNVHKYNPKPCGVCQKVFRTPALLSKHMIYHDQSKRCHVCPLCPDKPGWFTAVALKRHQSANHILRAGNICEICSLDFKTKPGLTQHMITEHGIDLPKRRK